MSGEGAWLGSDLALVSCTVEGVGEVGTNGVDEVDAGGDDAGGTVVIFHKCTMEGWIFVRH